MRELREIDVTRDRWLGAAADVCTAVRAALAPVVAWLLTRPRGGWLAFGLFGVAVATDFLDGRLARAGGHATTRGRLLDHGADVAFLLPALVVLGRARRISLALAPVVALTFGLYVLDGWRRGRATGAIELAPSRSGTAAGLANYAVVGGAAIAHGLGPSAFDGAVAAAAVATIAVNAVATLERLRDLCTDVSRPASPPVLEDG